MQFQKWSTESESAKHVITKLIELLFTTI